MSFTNQLVQYRNGHTADHMQDHSTEVIVNHMHYHSTENGHTADHMHDHTTEVIANRMHYHSTEMAIPLTICMTTLQK